MIQLTSSATRRRKAKYEVGIFQQKVGREIFLWIEYWLRKYEVPLNRPQYIGTDGPRVMTSFTNGLVGKLAVVIAPHTKKSSLTK